MRPPHARKRHHLGIHSRDPYHHPLERRSAGNGVQAASGRSELDARPSLHLCRRVGARAALLEARSATATGEERAQSHDAVGTEVTARHVAPDRTEPLLGSAVAIGAFTGSAGGALEGYLTV